MKEKSDSITKTGKKGKAWTAIFLIVVVGVLSFIAIFVGYVDPFFHYHKPNTDKYYYVLDNQRSQNYGIVKNFDYDALITGTSMSENFYTSEFDELFGTTSVKVPFFGANYKEVNDLIEYALKYNPNIKYVVRSLELYNFTTDKDKIRTDMGVAPEYLYDDNVLTDVKYVFNRDALYKRAIPMQIDTAKEDFEPGIDSFDKYSNWTSEYPNYGLSMIYPNGVTNPNLDAKVTLTEKEKATILANVKQNITDVADENPDITFLCFLPPYSVAWWRNFVDDGRVYRQMEVEKLAVSEILKHPNIKLYHFNELYDDVSNLTNYRDDTHYGEWISSDLLRYMKEDKYLLTEENYIEKFDEELDFYLNFDYESLNQQGDLVYIKGE